MDKDKFVKWIKEEIEGCQNRGETERVNAMQELLLKIERGYFDKEASVPRGTILYGSSKTDKPIVAKAKANEFQKGIDCRNS